MDRKSEELRGAVPLSHFFLRYRLKPGDRAVDATSGNGHDTLLLAELVGERGQVWGFDLQEEALERTRRMLSEHGCQDRVALHRLGHERMLEVVDGPVQAVIFNLGYLPGGDAALVTTPATTKAALDQARSLLAPGGLILVALYTGHAGGKEEEAAVLEWGAGLSPREFHVWTSRQLNRPSSAPYLLLVEKGAKASGGSFCAGRQ